MSNNMVNLDVKGMVIQMHIVVNEDGSLTARMGEGNVQLSATDAPELTTSRSITLKSVKEVDKDPVLMNEGEMGSKLTGLIREAIEECVDNDDNLCTHNLKSREDWYHQLNLDAISVADYYSDSIKEYTPAPEPEVPDENED